MTQFAVSIAAQLFIVTRIETSVLEGTPTKTASVEFIGLSVLGRVRLRSQRAVERGDARHGGVAALHQNSGPQAQDQVPVARRFGFVDVHPLAY
jgi:hypothetical protein